MRWFVRSAALFLSIGLLAQEKLLDQKYPIYQFQSEKQLKIIELREFQSIPVKFPIKLIHRRNRVYILDWMLSKVFAYNLTDSTTTTIGRPGQGPGDLERPSDFYIPSTDYIYVLNPQSRRLEVFSPEGRFLKRIVLRLSDKESFSFPNQFIIRPSQEILVTYMLSPSIIDLYDESGNYRRGLVRRDLPIKIPGKNIGNATDMIDAGQGKILIFDRFTGIFHIMDAMNRIERQFSAFSNLHAENVRKVLGSLKREKVKSGIQVMELYQWTNACIDKDENIYVASEFELENDSPLIYAFSSKGDFLYRKSFPELKGKRISNLYCYEDNFYFITAEKEIFSAKKEVGQ